MIKPPIRFIVIVDSPGEKMIKTTRILLYLNLLLFIRSPLWAEINATVVSFTGDVAVSRQGEFLNTSLLAEGMQIQPHDILQTGAGGRVELSINTPVSPEISVEVLEQTTLFLEHTLNKQNPETAITLHRGAIRSESAPLVPGASFKVNTSSASMRVMGTSFEVSIGVDGSVLISCSEGQVICTTDDEDSSIEPGRVFERTPNGQYRLKPLPIQDISWYTVQWQQEKRDLLSQEGVVLLENYANLYLQSAPGFLESWSELSSKQEIFRKWEGIMADGKTMSMGEATRDKIVLSNGIIRLRSRLPVMEHVFYTLFDLTRIMEAEDLDELSDTAKRTLLIYHKRQDEFSEKLTQARYYYRIFLEIDKQASGHSLMPSSDLMDDFMMNDSYFITPPAPGQ